MKFFREKITHREQNGVLPNGGQATRVVVDQTARADIILGNGSAAFIVKDPNNPDLPGTSITTVQLTTSFDDNRYEINIDGHRQLFVSAKVLVLGTVTGLEVLIEFLDPDHVNDDGSGLWIPSKEGVARDANEETNVHGPLTVGNYTLSSREETLHSKKARVSFRAAGGTASAATRIHTSWYHDGKPSVVAEQ